MLRCRDDAHRDIDRLVSVRQSAIETAIVDPRRAIRGVARIASVAVAQPNELPLTPDSQMYRDRGALDMRCHAQRMLTTDERDRSDDA